MSNLEFGIAANPDARMRVKASELSPRDRIISGIGEGHYIVIEPGSFTRPRTPKGQVEVALRAPSECFTWTGAADTPCVIDRPNFTIPGLED